MTRVLFEDRVLLVYGDSDRYKDPVEEFLEILLRCVNTSILTGPPKQFLHLENRVTGP